ALRESGAELAIAYQHIGRRTTGVANLENRRGRAEESAHVKNRPQLRSGDPVGYDRRRMAVHDCLHVRTCAVDLAVDEPLQITAPSAFVYRIPGQIVLHDVCRRDRPRRDTTR